MIMWLIYVLIFIFGTCIGSFLNVVILRLRRNAPRRVLGGRSRCPQCGHVLRWHENIPILSFIALRGKCSKCKQKISWQYPIVEFATGTLFLLAFFNVFNDFNALNIHFITLLLYYFITISFLIIIFVYDLKYYLILDKISVPAIITVLFFQAILLILKYNNDYSLLVTRYSLLLFSAIIISAFFLLQFVISKGKWIGGGDIRLGFLMGVILGWPLGVAALFLSYILGLIISLPLLILGRKKLKSEIPFGVFLAPATLVVLFWGERILNWYLSFF